MEAPEDHGSGVWVQESGLRWPSEGADMSAVDTGLRKAFLPTGPLSLHSCLPLPKSPIPDWCHDEITGARWAHLQMVL